MTEPKIIASARREDNAVHSIGVGLPSKLSFAVLALASLVLACASLNESAAPVPARSKAMQDGPTFEGSAPRVPGSYGKLVLEKDFEQSRKLRWQSDDTRIGPTEVDFFEPREWRVEGDPATMLSFADRSPGPILFGEVLLGVRGRAVVTVVLGKERVVYNLERSDLEEIDGVASVERRGAP